MKLNEVEDQIKLLGNYLGKTSKSGIKTFAIIPIPKTTDIENMKVFCTLYLDKKVEDAITLTQTENSDFEIGVICKEDNMQTFGISTFKDEFL
jgi:hypothetical protein